MFPEILTAVWSDWFDAPEWISEPGMVPVGASRRLQYRALRSETEHEFLVARMRPGSTIATLEDVEQTICEIKTDRGFEPQMRRDYQAAEAFAVFLTVLPDLIRMRDCLDGIIQPEGDMSAMPGVVEVGDD
jgi:hypothetical protein